MSHAPTAKPPFDLKSTSWILTALRLHSADLGALAAALDERFADSPGLFDDDPLVIDLSPLREADVEVDVAGLLTHLRRLGMTAIAAQGGSPTQMAAARAAGLVQAMEPDTRHEPRNDLRAEPQAVVRDDPHASTATAAVAVDALPVMLDEVSVQALEALRAAPRGDAAEPAPDEVVDVAADSPPEAATQPSEAVPAAPRTPALVVDKPLRSGQRVYARGRDLVVLSVVSFGAEVIADGSIHVYAPLRGRAMAGARGDTEARIFSTCMEPQLMSIAGIYRTTETPLTADVAGKPAQVRLVGEKILVEPLGG